LSTLNLRSAVSVGLAGLLVGGLITRYARADTSAATSPSASGLLGFVLPAITLRAPDGTPVLLADRLSRGPSLIIVMGGQDCFSCSSYELELTILKSKLPGVSAILIGSGEDEALFRDYFRRSHLDSLALFDRDRQVLTSLGVKSEPLVLLVDSTGRILFADSRSSSAAAQFPLGRLLPLLGGALHPAPSSLTKSGEPK
jgi:hypothetical protein